MGKFEDAIHAGYGSINLKLCPLTKEEYRSFLPKPAGTRRAELLALVKWYTNEEFVSLKLEAGGE